MAVIKCKMCGGDLDLVAGTKVCECEYCGTKQTVPDTNDEKRLNLYNRANRLRIACEFDKAAGIYESIIAEFPEEAEAYWGLCLSTYGIEYVDDPATARKVPTCHRASFEKMRKDVNYELALENADMTSRMVYEDQAKEIDRIMGEILAVSRTEEPYDIFICYKEADRSGARTPDSVLAQDIYDALIAKGYRVFFSRITLEDKLGAQYEPYIFSALQSAKVMLVVGTDYEYLNAVWVKNEWSRFLKLSAKDKTRALIPCYKDMDPYDMPDELQGLQSQDCGKLGFMQDLTRGIDKLFGRAAETQPAPQQVVVQNASGVNLTAQIKRGMMALEDGEWEAADNFFDKALDLDAECAEAYLGKLMAEQRARRQADLVECEQPFDCSNNYIKAVRFGGEKLVSALKGYITHIKERNETNRLTGIYHKAVSAMNAACSESAYKAAEKAFKTIPGFRDADALAKQCVERAEELRKSEKQKVQAVVRALKEGSNAKASSTLEEKLTAAKTRIGELERILTVFDVAKAQVQDLQNELADVTSLEKRLAEQRSRLGIFSGKEKKRIDMELSAISAKKADLVARINQQQNTIGRYSAIEDVERDLGEAKRSAADIEAQIEIVHANVDFDYSFEEALNVYQSEPDVATTVDGIYPVARLIPVKLGKTDTVQFGRYVQKRGKPEPIVWQVLAKEPQRILVISRYALDYQPYNTSFTNITWESCSLRKWLNETFLNVAFSKEERAMIPSVTVSADKNPDHTTSPGKSATDRVFLLSIKETHKYFSGDRARQCQGTSYCYAQGAYMNYNDGNCMWWLRSPGNSSKSAACVNHDGSVNTYGRFVGLSSVGDKIAVRPALWISF